MSEEYIHIDQAVEVVLENGWLTEKDIVGYLKDMKSKDFFMKLSKLLLKEGIKIRKLSLEEKSWKRTINPSKRNQSD